MPLRASKMQEYSFSLFNSSCGYCVSTKLEKNHAWLNPGLKLTVVSIQDGTDVTVIELVVKSGRWRIQVGELSALSHG